MPLRTKHKVGRNERCMCGSGLKFKHCHGDPQKVAVCNRVANEKMVELIVAEKRKRKMPIELVCPICKQIPAITSSCEFCNKTGIVTEKDLKKRYDEAAEKLESEKGDKE